MTFYKFYIILYLVYIFYGGELKKLYKEANYDIYVKVIRSDSSAVILRCYVWGKDISESFENSCKLNENLKKVFDKNNIEIPYNYINVINKK